MKGGCPIIKDDSEQKGGYFMIRKDCINYHCEHDMGASIDCCMLKGLGNCPCSSDCNDYANRNEIYLLGLEVFKKRKENKEHTK